SDGADAGVELRSLQQAPDVLRIAGEHRVAATDEQYESRVGDVAGSAPCQQQPAAAGGELVERPLHDPLERSRESRLAGGIAPDLGDACRGGDRLVAIPGCDREQRADCTIAAIEGDQPAGVEDEGSHLEASLSSSSVYGPPVAAAISSATPDSVSKRRRAAAASASQPDTPLGPAASRTRWYSPSSKLTLILATTSW